MTKTKLELLSPAKNLECGIEAINCGADAVYIGAPKFGARSAAGNSIEDIKALTEYAHKFWAKVYVAINTILFDNELEEVKRLINRLYNIGVDAIIFQDMALLEMDIPPIQLFASTQTHNYEIDRIKLLDELGIRRIILARELSIDQIKEIKNSVNADLEFFVHGALCVCFSGQCYMSFDLNERSANRGECSQPCRKPYSLVDREGRIIVKDKHLLSLKDLNLSEYLAELVDAGITSFKIEGRLKEVDYVKNVTAFYRNRLDQIIAEKPQFQKASSGNSIIPFTPDLDRTFNREYTTYFINGKQGKQASLNTPKAKGKYLGKVKTITQGSFTIATEEIIKNGDGICFFDDKKNLTGMSVDKVIDNKIFTSDLKSLKVGSDIYRNIDHSFQKELLKECVRKIEVSIYAEMEDNQMHFIAIDIDGNQSKLTVENKFEIAVNKEKAEQTLYHQFSKTGNTVFTVKEIKVAFANIPYISVKDLNEIRRNLLDLLLEKRISNHSIEKQSKNLNVNKGVEPILSYKMNVVNKLSEKLYRKLGAEVIEIGFEKNASVKDNVLMTCSYCIKDELDMCPLDTKVKLEEPLYLISGSKKYLLNFNCAYCKMEIKPA